MENFATLAQTLVAKNSAIQVLDVDELERAAEKLLRDNGARQLLVQRAEEALAQHRGATARTAQLVVDLG
jgi:3-deoxy-D-manno-octulosonic-acid transferase